MAKHKNEQKQSIYLAAHGNYSGLCLNYRPKSKRILDLLIEKAFSYDPKIGGLENTSELCDLGVPPAYVVTSGWDKSCPPSFIFTSDSLGYKAVCSSGEATFDIGLSLQSCL